MRDVNVLVDTLQRFIAPPALLSALAFFYGWTLTDARSSYFGIDPSTLGFGTNDYILRSTDALFVPLGVMLLVLLCLLAVTATLNGKLESDRSHGWIRHGARLMSVVGGAATGAGVWAMFRPLPLLTYYLLPPVLLGGGVALGY